VVRGTKQKIWCALLLGQEQTAAGDAWPVAARGATARWTGPGRWRRPDWGQRSRGRARSRGGRSLRASSAPSTNPPTVSTRSTAYARRSRATAACRTPRSAPAWSVRRARARQTPTRESRRNGSRSPAQPHPSPDGPTHPPAAAGGPCAACWAGRSACAPCTPRASGWAGGASTGPSCVAFARAPLARARAGSATARGACGMAPGHAAHCRLHAQFMAELTSQFGEAMIAELDVLLPACIEAMGSSSASVRQAAVQTMCACGKVS